MTGISSGSIQYSLPLFLFIPPCEYSLEIMKLLIIPKVFTMGILSPTFWCLWCLCLHLSCLDALHHQCRRAGTSRLRCLSSILAMIHILDSLLSKKEESGPVTQREVPSTAEPIALCGFPVLFGFWGGFDFPCSYRVLQEKKWRLIPSCL